MTGSPPRFCPHERDRGRCRLTKLSCLQKQTGEPENIIAGLFAEANRRQRRGALRSVHGTRRRVEEGTRRGPDDAGASRCRGRHRPTAPLAARKQPQKPDRGHASADLSGLGRACIRDPRSRRAIRAGCDELMLVRSCWPRYSRRSDGPVRWPPCRRRPGTSASHRC